MERMKQLIKEINRHNYNYYVLDNPTISDYEYDLLLDELIELEKQTGIIYPDSPTQRVGDGVLEGFKKYKHKTPMYSLEKCTDYDILQKWLNNIKQKYDDADFCLEYKFDGLSVVLEYENGYLKTAATRGNGRIGEDVTAQIKTIKNVPLSIPFKGHLVVAGECIMSISNFEKYNKTATEKLKNPRNAAAGALRNLDLKVTGSRNLSVIIYSLLSIDGKEFETQKQTRDFFIENSLPCDDYFFVLADSGKIIEKLNEIDKIKDKLNIQIDGAVIKLNQLAYRTELGFTAKHPRWAIAFKYAPLELSTKLNDVIWQVGRTGKITPIALVEPVELSGALVKRATLNNIDDIIKKNISINSTVFIRRSNEVIPEITGVASVAEDAVKILPPQICPSCNSNLVEIGANLFCPNQRECKEQIVERLIHFTSRNAMNIEGLSEKTIIRLNQKFKIAYPYELYYLNADMLAQIEGFKDKKIANILSSIQKSTQVDYANFIYALGILLVGSKTAYVLSKNFDSFDKLVLATAQSLTQIRDIGEIVAGSIIEFFSDAQNIQNINKLFYAGVTIKYPDNSTKNVNFLNKKIVLTGSLQEFSRAELTKKLLEMGADVATSVSKKTDMVIFGKDAGSKLNDAIKLGIMTINEQQLKEMLNN